MTDLIAKLAEVQAELHAPKDQYNSFSNFSYRSAEDILEAVKPLLHARGLALTITDDLVHTGDRYYVKATADVTDGTEHIAVSSFARESENRKGYDDAQLTGSTSSYARKYALNGLFCIDDAEDPDTDAHTQQRQQETPPSRRIPASNPPDPDYGDDKEWADAMDALAGAVQDQVPEIDGQAVARVMAKLAGYNGIVNTPAERLARMAIFAKSPDFLPYYTDEIVPVLAKEK